MRHFWLKKENNPNLILFFAGWGMDENPLKHIDSKGVDVLLIYDYNDLTLAANLSQYAEITVIAWSMGVLAASIVCEKIHVTRAIAINGTQNPIDVKFGINPKLYQFTLDNLSEITRDKFFQNMFLDEKKYEKLQKPERNLENQRKELANLQKIAQKTTELKFDFDCAIISTQDKIIPTKNQQRFWQTKKVKVVELNSGHYPFFELSSIEEILDETL